MEIAKGGERGYIRNICNICTILFSGKLLREFFGYYGDLNLADQGICVINGGFIPKREEHVDADLYLVNPLEPELNAARIVNKGYVNLFQEKCREALSHLNNTTTVDGHRNHESKDWGLVGLCRSEIQETGEIMTGDNGNEGVEGTPNETETSVNVENNPLDVTDLFKRGIATDDETSQTDTSIKVLQTVN